jgi:hypothetical protein
MLDDYTNTEIVADLLNSGFQISTRTLRRRPQYWTFCSMGWLGLWCGEGEAGTSSLIKLTAGSSWWLLPKHARNRLALIRRTLLIQALYSPPNSPFTAPPLISHLFCILGTSSVSSLKMAETKNERSDKGVEVSADDVAPSTQESANSQSLEVGLTELISRWSDSIR